MSLPYFNLYPKDFEADTSHLTLEEDGAYNRLLRLCWMTPGCSIPDDDEWIARRMRVDPETYQRVVRPIIAEFFSRRDGRVSNARLMLEQERSSAAHARRVSAGKKGGNAKALKNNENGHSIATAMPKQPEPEPDIYTIPNGMGSEAAAGVDFTKEVFDLGVAFLGRYGITDRKARALIGMWRKEAGDTETFHAITAASQGGITDPVPWIVARLKPKPAFTPEFDLTRYGNA